jgi:hypothetical protein
MRSIDQSQRLANVAMSRARGKFILVGNADYVLSQLPDKNGFYQLFSALHNEGYYFAPEWNGAEDIVTREGSITVFHGARSAKPALNQDLEQVKTEAALVWSLPDLQAWVSLNKLAHASVYVSGTGSDSIQQTYPKVPIRTWLGNQNAQYGLLGLDHRIVWVIIDPDSTDSPAIRLDLPKTAALLHSLMRLEPHSASNSSVLSDNQIAETGPASSKCRSCGGLYTIDLDDYENPVLRCTDQDCRRTTRVTEDVVTNWARMFGITCPECGGPMHGRKSDRGVFLSCFRFPNCRGTRNLKKLI